MALPVPDDALADILRRLPPRSLAAARCVCKPWRDLVDGRALLLPRLLPHSVHGVLINYIDHDRPHLFSRRRSRSRSRSSSPAASSGGGDIDGNLSSVPPKGDMDWWHVMDHCDGLLLCAVEWGNRLCVCNPATRRWATLPRCPESPKPIRYGTGGAYLAFDPAAASPPHYEVFLIPGLPEKPPPPPPKQKAKAITAPPFCLDSLLASLDGACWTMEEVEPPPPPSPPASSMGDADLYRLMEWPPSPYKVYVFSSRSGRWEERAIVREGGETAATTTTTVDDMEPWECPLEGPRQRFSLSNDKYQVISTPKIIGSSNFEKPYLGKSKMGVSFGFIQDLQLSIWILKESAGQMEWILNYQHDLRAVASQVHSIDFWGDQINGPWILEEDNADMHVNTETLGQRS
uniref:F-box domain-containing protein n=1 Tax=Oryza glumipatula TaxID=40148 RepID=A0A0E0ABX9_9ORYZ